MTRLLSLLATWAIGPACPVCRERQRGPRTLAAHQWVEHRGET